MGLGAGNGLALEEGENNSINPCWKGDWLPKWAPGFVTDCENTCAVLENKVSTVS